jgi:hypothetical protein
LLLDEFSIVISDDDVKKDGPCVCVVMRRFLGSGVGMG